jgi:hypothetical protein
MVKKLSLLGLCILGLLLPTWAQVVSEGPAMIEHVVFVSADNWPLWEYRPVDPTVSTYFKSPILLSFDVPPSPKSPMMFFEVWGQFLYTWTSNRSRTRLLTMGYRFTSPAFPNIEINQGFGVPPGVSETNYAEDHMYPADDTTGRVKGYWKGALRRTYKGNWNVFDKSTGQYLPSDLALPIIGGFIDGGYRVEVWAEGTVEGLSYIAPVYWQVQITRLSHKK